MKGEIPKLMDAVADFTERPELQVVLQHIKTQRKKRDKNREGAPALLHLLLDDDGLTNSEIAERLAIKPSSVTAMTKKLVSWGLAKQVEDEKDKRLSRIYLTTAGRNHLVHLNQFLQDYSKIVFAGLNEADRHTLLNLLNQVNEHASTEQAIALFDQYEGKIMGLDKMQHDFERVRHAMER
jgi:DNA-binding MarR family transcriptional regulator